MWCDEDQEHLEVSAQCRGCLSVQVGYQEKFPPVMDERGLPRSGAHHHLWGAPECRDVALGDPSVGTVGLGWGWI